MTKHFIFICFSIAAFSCSAPKPETQAEPPVAPQNMPRTDVGKTIFGEKCIVCHGADGTAGIAHAANLQTSGIDSLSVTHTVTHGKNAMPAFDSQLSAGEIEQVTAYVLSLRK